ncbi:MAG: hypothetical protein IKW13_01580 [Thermoguttaceae bacterium]|nr:hypothetical protein [Thermoguttaceae bacterium]
MKINWLALEIELLEEQTRATAALARTTALLGWLHNRGEQGEPGATLSYRSNAFDAELGFENAYALGKYTAQANARARKIERLATATEAPEYVERVRVLRLISLLGLARLGAGGSISTLPPDLRRFLDADSDELAAKFAKELGAADEEAARSVVAADIEAADDWL